MRSWRAATTITGSIGVFAVVPTIDRTLSRLGVRVDGVGTTSLSGVLRVDRPLQPEIEGLLQAGVDHTYAEFLQRVASGRHQTTAAIDEIAQGRVWAGSDALRLHLIDRLGNYDDAVHAAAQRAKLGKGYDVRLIEPELSFTEELLLSMRSGAVRAYRALGLSGGSYASVAARLGPQLEPLERELLRWQRFAAVPNHTLAYCFCTAD